MTCPLALPLGRAWPGILTVSLLGTRVYRLFHWKRNVSESPAFWATDDRLQTASKARGNLTHWLQIHYERLRLMEAKESQ